VVVGLILASVAAGRIGGVLVLGRFVSGAERRRLMWPMALACTVPLLLVATGPGLAITLVLLGLAGVGSSFQVAANTAFAAAAPEALRGRVFGVALTGMYAAQGAAVLAAGAAAQVLAPNTVVTGAAVLGAISILALRRATDSRLDRE
jgi:MFS family permease